MSTPKEHIIVLKEEVKRIEEGKHIQQPDEFAAIADVMAAIIQLEKAFERDVYMGDYKR